MRIVEINQSSTGAHRNQTIIFGKLSNIPDGWAVIPDNMETPNFPFGEVKAEKINGVMTVTNWVAGTVPAPVVLPEEGNETGVGEVEQLRADVDYIAIMTGVEL